MPTLAVSADVMAMPASSSASGCTLTAQSPYTSTLSGRHMKNTEDTTPPPLALRTWGMAEGGQQEGCSRRFAKGCRGWVDAGGCMGLEGSRGEGSCREHKQHATW